MNNLDAILEVVIGLVFTWLILSVATMEAQNIITKFFNVRANFLEESILNMFGGEQKYLDEFYAHPAIKVLYKKDWVGKLKKPDYIPNQIFAAVAYEMFINLGVDERNLAQNSISINKILSKIEEINKENPKLGYAIRRILPDFDGVETLSRLQDIESKTAEFKENAEAWFDTSMNLASRWYTEKARTVAFLIGLTLAITVNVDTIAITQQLWREPTLRQTLVAQAQAADSNIGPDSVENLEAYYQDLRLPVGWSTKRADNIVACKWISVRNMEFAVERSNQCYTLPALPALNDGWGWIVKLFGILISAIAAMQGAPFWFDMLKKLLQLSGKKESDATPPALPPQQPPPAEPVG